MNPETAPGPAGCRTPSPADRGPRTVVGVEPTAPSGTGHGMALVATEVLSELRKAGVITHHVALSPSGPGWMVYLEGYAGQHEEAVEVLEKMPAVGAVTFPTASRAILHVTPAPVGP